MPKKPDRWAMYLRGIAVTFNYLSLDTYLFLMVSYLMNNSSADGEKTRIVNCHQAKINNNQEHC